MPETAGMVCIRASGTETVRTPPIYLSVYLITEDVIEYSFDSHSLLLSDAGSRVKWPTYDEAKKAVRYKERLQVECHCYLIFCILWNILFL